MRKERDRIPSYVSTISALRGSPNEPLIAPLFILLIIWFVYYLLYIRHISTFPHFRVSNIKPVPVPYRDSIRIPDLEPAIQFMRNPLFRKSQIADRESMIIAGGMDVAGWMARIPPVM